MYEKIREKSGSIMFQKIQEASERLRNLFKDSIMLLKIKETFERFENLLKYSRIFLKLKKILDFLKCLKFKHLTIF
jgi:hypothetical protein